MLVWLTKHAHPSPQLSLYSLIIYLFKWFSKIINIHEKFDPTFIILGPYYLQITKQRNYNWLLIDQKLIIRIKPSLILMIKQGE